MDNPTPISGGEIAAGGGSTTTSPAPSQPASPPPAPADAPSTQAGNPPASGSWFDQLPEELKGSKSLAKFKDVNILLRPMFMRNRSLDAIKFRYRRPMKTGKTSITALGALLRLMIILSMLMLLSKCSFLRI